MRKEQRSILHSAFLATSATLGIYPISRTLLNSSIVLLAIFFLYIGGQKVLVSDELAVRKAFILSGLLVFGVVFVFHVGREYALAKPEPVLSIIYDRNKCRTIVGDGTCAAIRIIARNKGDDSISGVRLVIDRVIRTGGKENDGDASKRTGPFIEIGMDAGLRQFDGLPLGIAPSRSDQMPVRLEKPETSMTLHSGRDCFFDLMRICKQPANHSIQHAAYRPNRHFGQGHPHPVERYPRGTIPPGDYEITLTIMGDNVEPVTKEFRVKAGEIEEK